MSHLSPVPNLGNVLFTVNTVELGGYHVSPYCSIFCCNNYITVLRG